MGSKLPDKPTAAQIAAPKILPPPPPPMRGQGSNRSTSPKPKLSDYQVLLVVTALQVQIKTLEDFRSCETIKAMEGSQEILGNHIDEIKSACNIIEIQNGRTPSYVLDKIEQQANANDAWQEFGQAIKPDRS